jgi:hypothetical protein
LFVHYYPRILHVAEIIVANRPEILANTIAAPRGVTIALDATSCRSMYGNKILRIACDTAEMEIAIPIAYNTTKLPVSGIKIIAAIATNGSNLVISFIMPCLENITICPS